MSKSSLAKQISLSREGHPKDPIKITISRLNKARLVIRSVNHMLRQNILFILEQNKRMTVTDIFIKLRLEQSVASQHLAILRYYGLVKTQRDGKFIYYSLNMDRIEEIVGLINELAK